MVIIQWSTRETVPTIGHRHLCHRVLYFRTFYMFSSTSIFKTRSAETTGPLPYLQPSTSLTKGLHAARAPTRPPTRWAEWLMPSLVPHAWICRTKQKGRTCSANCALLEVWTIATSTDLLLVHIYNIHTVHMLIENIVPILVLQLRVVSVRACRGAMPLGLDQEDGRCTLFSACWQL